jgi:hypothetical protein
VVVVVAAASEAAVGAAADAIVVVVTAPAGSKCHFIASESESDITTRPSAA